MKYKAKKDKELNPEELEAYLTLRKVILKGIEKEQEKTILAYGGGYGL